MYQEGKEQWSVAYWGGELRSKQEEQKEEETW